MRRVAVAPAPFDAGAVLAGMSADGAAGGVGCFLGVVRGGGPAPDAVTALELEHYPGMTEVALDAIAAEAERRFALLDCVVIHRVGVLAPGEPIVLVAASAPGRAASLDATRFLIDWLKTRAPFWKREHRRDGTSAWVDARASDDEAAAMWEAEGASPLEPHQGPDGPWIPGSGG